MRRPVVLVLGAVAVLVVVTATAWYLGRRAGRTAEPRVDLPTAANARASERPPPPDEEEGPAVVDLLPLHGGRVAGSIILVEPPAGDGLQVRYTIRRLPAGRHALVLHEIGDCSSADGSSAGGYFPVDGGAGRPSAELGELVANVAGQARGSFVREGLELDPIVGRSVLVETEGDAGELRALACGAILRR